MHYLTSALDGGEWSASRPGRFTPRERDPGTHWIGGWGGPRAVLDTVVKRKIPSPHWESNPRTQLLEDVRHIIIIIITERHKDRSLAQFSATVPQVICVLKKQTYFSLFLL
jgi:hypothetical protein